MLRRSFLLGALTAASAAALAGCTVPRVTPTATPGATTGPTGGEATPTATASTAALPEPISFTRSAWSTDPFSLGAVSYLRTGATPSDRAALAEPIDGRVFLAGEATAAERAGTVAGAWLSGLRAASDVAARATAGDRVAILGAGIAGAAAAQQLHAAGFEVVVLEGRDRVGGRIDTVTGDDWPFPVERGAYLLPDPVTSPLIGELVALEVETALIDAPGETRTTDGAVVESPSDLEELAGIAVDQAREADGDRSLASVLDELRSTAWSAPEGSPVDASSWVDWYLATEVAETTGADATEVSARYGFQVDGAPPLMVLGGLGTLVDNALVDVDVRLSNVVGGVRLTDEGVGLILVNGESFSADRVIVTVPLGVLQSGAIGFDPPLPESHLAALDAVSVGSKESVVLRFEDRFWESDAVEWTVVDSDALIRTWYNLEPLTGEPVLIGSVAGAAAVEFASLSDDEVRDAALASLLPFVAV